MRWFVAVLYIAAVVLLLAALVRAGVRVLREHRRLAEKLDEIDRIIHDKSLSTAEQTEMTRAILEPQFTWGRVTYTYEWIQRLILRDALAELRGPAALTVLGVISGTTASVLSLWLPAS